MKISAKLLVPFVILVFAVLILMFQEKVEAKTNVCFREICVDAQIADTPDERALGLMYRTSLPENEGLFFIFDASERHPFWMKNTLISLDVIWIDENYRVVDIQSLEPCEEDPCESFTPNSRALYVLEVNSGFADANGISIGDKASV